MTLKTGMEHGQYSNNKSLAKATIGPELNGTTGLLKNVVHDRQRGSNAKLAVLQLNDVTIECRHSICVKYRR